MALNLLLSLLLKVGEVKDAINIEKLEIGDQIYFNRPRASVVVNFLGPVKDYPDNFLIVTPCVFLPALLIFFTATLIIRHLFVEIICLKSFC